ncbi:hypothetical protein A6E01_20250 (plasmid) [Vibrio breoganii]|uniref:Uncharacterized protein n=1 Tax=Vibrio breoganii TaxID=553239 RepID=A0AAN0XZH3_9VIBR|nr:hypothetical protein [Vibrio breoganii]ANO35546.1 hypothetical protein A6E01_20250 [Vibrio breoganii]PML15809.1 hypothetical protein BCT84_07345 [Vibrio breoganii]
MKFVNGLVLATVLASTGVMAGGLGKTGQDDRQHIRSERVTLDVAVTADGEAHKIGDWHKTNNRKR